MNVVVPMGPQSSPSTNFSRLQYTKSVAGIVYLVCSVVCSIQYLAIMHPTLANDFFWSGFNLSSQLCVMNVLNSVHAITNASSIPLSSPLLAQSGDFLTNPKKYAISSPTHTRRVLYTSLTSIEKAIASCRTITISAQLLWLPTQFCWVDLTKRWQLAHTIKRQRRCEDSWYGSNGAMYLETLWRNTNMTQFVVDTAVDLAIAFAPLLDTSNPDAVTFMASLYKPWLSVADEALHWRRYNVTTWRLQYMNHMHIGMSGSAALVPAIGNVVKLAINHIPRSSRSSQWTTYIMFTNLYNALANAASANCSLVRGPDNFYYRLYPDEFVLPSMFAASVIYNNIGPLGSVDLYLVPVPEPLQHLYRTFRATWIQAQWGSLSISADVDAMDLQTIHNPVVPAWASYSSFFGGSPLCIQETKEPTPYLQREWGFEDVCSGPPTAMEVPVTQAALVLAMVASVSSGFGSLELWSLQCHEWADAPDQVLPCLRRMNALFAVAQELAGSMLFSSLVQAVMASPATAVEITQFAWDDNQEAVLLRQTLLDHNDTTFRLLGWVFMFDWADGTREVVSFEGDEGTLELMSNRDSTVFLTDSEPDQVPQSVGYFLGLAASYVSFVLAAIAAFTVFTSMRFKGQTSGHNMMYFNRVAGLTWVGRPLLLMRATTALVVLSSTTATIVHQNGWTTFVDTPRPVWQSLLLAGEATWMSYVVTDVCLVWSARAVVEAWGSTLLVFVSVVVLDVVAPVTTQISAQQDCVAEQLVMNVACSGITLTSGSFSRFGFICVGSTFLAALVLRLAPPPATAPLNSDTTPHLLYPGAAVAFFEIRAASIPDEWWIDHSSSLMCGLIFFSYRGKDYALDVKSWLLVTLNACAFSSVGACSLIRSSTVRRSSLVRLPSSPKPGDAMPPRFWRLRVALGLLYAMGSLGGSTMYLAVLYKKMSNDLWWAGFNTTGGHRFLATLALTDGLVTNGSLGDDKHILRGKSFDLPIDTVELRPNLATIAVHRELRNLTQAIAGIRSASACDAPWLATSYCWVDFNAKWEMAKSAARQQRCAERETDNAAVYLEAVVRNVNWIEFQSCWGDSFEAAIASELRATKPGQAWLKTATAVSSTVAEELTYWRWKRMTRFDVMWQNGRLHGLFKVVNVQNAFGHLYPLTLTESSAVDRFTDETSTKMYWRLASDFWAIVSNDTVLAGKSLVRTSQNYAYANTTPHEVFVQNYTLQSPPSWVMDVFESRIGPYGIVDVKHVPAPPAVVQFFATLEEDLNRALYYNADLSTHLTSFPSEWYFTVRPAKWNEAPGVYFGGNPLCGAPVDPYYEIYTFLDATAPCVSPSLEGLVLDGPQGVMAFVASNDGNYSQVCNNVAEVSVCQNMLGTVQAFVDKAFERQYKLDKQREFHALLADNIVQAVSLFQFAAMGFEHTMATAPAFTATDGWRLFGAAYMQQWALGYREVVALEGDLGAITVLSTSTKSNLYKLNAAELPHSISLFFKRVVQYVTTTFFILAAMMIVYIIATRGVIEPLNLLELNRVAGIVWVGRPLLSLRAISAMCLLSTAHIELRTDPTGLSTKFISPTATWIDSVRTIVVSIEVCWLTFILNDIFSVVTQGYTKYYATKSVVLLVMATAILQLVAPLGVEASPHWECAMLDLDAAAVCNIGVIRVGYPGRFMTFVGLNIASVVICVGLEVWRQPKLPQSPPPLLFLYSLATHTFELDAWTVDNVVYLDLASAFLSGLVVVPRGGFLYMLDIKTWRLHRIRKPAIRGSSIRTRRLASCVPLVHNESTV